MADEALSLYLRAVESDEDADTVAQACASMAECIRGGGAAATQSSEASFQLLQTCNPPLPPSPDISWFAPPPAPPVVDPICAAVQGLLCGQAACQEEAVEEEEEGCSNVQEAAAELLPALAAVLGPAFQPHFQTILPPLLRFTVPHT